MEVQILSSGLLYIPIKEEKSKMDAKTARIKLWTKREDLLASGNTRKIREAEGVAELLTLSFPWKRQSIQDKMLQFLEKFEKKGLIHDNY